MSSQTFLIKSDSALFIDRDGVINTLRVDDYVKQISEFELLPEVIPALDILRPLFKRIFIVTNQQGIGKGLMVNSIEEIHNHFLSLLPSSIYPDKIYHCPHLKNENCICRKPKPGMALMAKSDFPEIQLSNSIMIGDSQSDMDFAKNSGIKPALVSSNNSSEYPTFNNILAFAQSLIQN
ncbi:MAG: D-glycero-alpha-D-manno-heptose-1,7-bisphosphate 7-phosphatase [Bacteroidia bacterium]